MGSSHDVGVSLLAGTAEAGVQESAAPVAVEWCRGGDGYAAKDSAGPCRTVRRAGSVWLD